MIKWNLCSILMDVTWQWNVLNHLSRLAVSQRCPFYYHTNLFRQYFKRKLISLSDYVELLPQFFVNPQRMLMDFGNSLRQQTKPWSTRTEPSRNIYWNRAVFNGLVEYFILLNKEWNLQIGGKKINFNSWNCDMWYVFLSSLIKRKNL